MAMDQVLKKDQTKKKVEIHLISVSAQNTKKNMLMHVMRWKFFYNKSTLNIRNSTNTKIENLQIGTKKNLLKNNKLRQDQNKYRTMKNQMKCNQSKKKRRILRAKTKTEWLRFKLHYNNWIIKIKTISTMISLENLWKQWIRSSLINIIFQLLSTLNSKANNRTHLVFILVSNNNSNFKITNLNPFSQVLKARTSIIRFRISITNTILKVTNNITKIKISEYDHMINLNDTVRIYIKNTTYK